MERVASKIISFLLMFNLFNNFSYANSKVDISVESSDNKEVKGSGPVKKISKKDLELGNLTDEHLANSMYHQIAMASVFGTISLAGLVTCACTLGHLVSNDCRNVGCGLEPLAYGIASLGSGAVGALFGFLSYKSIKDAIATDALREEYRSLNKISQKSAVNKQI